MIYKKRYGTFLPVLMRALQLTQGNVLEIGMGQFSTPYLHFATTPFARKLVSYESDQEYFSTYKQYKNEYHEINYVQDWDFTPIEKPWDVALIDHKPAERRIQEIKRLAYLAKYIIVHDSNIENDYLYKYSSIYHMFAYKYDFTLLNPHTLVLSNFTNLKSIQIQ